MKKKIWEMERLVNQGTNVSNVPMGCVGTADVVLFGNGTCDDIMGMEHVIILWEWNM